MECGGGTLNLVSPLSKRSTAVFVLCCTINSFNEEWEPIHDNQDEVYSSKSALRVSMDFGATRPSAPRLVTLAEDESDNHNSSQPHTS